MIVYNPKNWFGLIFKFHKSDTFRQLAVLMFILASYAGLIAYIEVEVLLLKYKTTTIMHSMLGVIIGLLLVFRTNTAYERWWEGRKLWGSLLNNSRNLALKLHAYLPQHDAENRIKMHDLMSNFATALQYHLVGKTNTIEQEGPKVHQPNQLAKDMMTVVNQLHQNQHINHYQFLTLNHELQQFTEITGACERIKKTPIPFSYSMFIKKFIFIYIMSMPFCFVTDFGYWVIMITVFVFYVLVSLELIAEEIEDPFGYDANDLPMNAICENISKSTHEIFEL